MIDDDRSSLGVVPEFHFQTTLLDHPYLQPVLAHSVLAKCCPQHGAVPQRLDLLVIAPPFWAENTAPTSTKRRKVVTLGWVLGDECWVQRVWPLDESPKGAALGLPNDHVQGGLAQGDVHSQVLEAMVLSGGGGVGTAHGVGRRELPCAARIASHQWVWEPRPPESCCPAEWRVHFPRMQPHHQQMRLSGPEERVQPLCPCAAERSGS